ncbi:MAG TPA: Arc family DNA-binding protein [Rubrivivax sp.]|nr:Arc family DNA-binding protein [Rubrivivax sp.]
MSVNLSIKDVPDDVAERLRARATRNHRSLQGELMAIVEQAAAEAQAPSDVYRSAVFVQRGSKSIEQIAAEARKRFPQPLAGEPRSVDIIRQDRDSR